MSALFSKVSYFLLGAATVISRPERQNNPATPLLQTCLQKRADPAKLSLRRDYAASYIENPAHQQMNDVGITL